MGTTVIGGLGPGLGQDINPFDPNYQELMRRAQNQKIADSWNAAQTAQYKLTAANAKAQNVQLQAAHQPLVGIAPPPHKQVLDAAGNTVQSPEFVCDAISVQVDPPTDKPSDTIASDHPTADRTDQLLSQNAALNAKLDLITNMLRALYASLAPKV